MGPERRVSWTGPKVGFVRIPVVRGHKSCRRAAIDHSEFQATTHYCRNGVFFREPAEFDWNLTRVYRVQKDMVFQQLSSVQLWYELV